MPWRRGGGSSVHSTVHTDLYRAEINEAMLTFQSEAEVLDYLDGTPRLARWTPPAVYLRAIDDRGRPRRRADLPWVGAQALALRARAVDALRDVLEQYSELLPVVSREDEDLLLFNVLKVVDALDKERSEIVRAPSSGRIMDIRRWHLRDGMLEGLDLFRLTGWPSSSSRIGSRPAWRLRG